MAANDHRFCKQTRVLEITLVADVSDNAFHVSSVTFGRVTDCSGPQFNVPFAHTDSNPEDVMLGEALPQDISVIRLTGTIQA
jgi:hypothetical protein